MDLRSELSDLIDPAVSFDAALEKICALKQRGANADEAQAVLEAMFQETADEQTQARIADLLDCVVGWCAPHYAIWK